MTNAEEIIRTVGALLRRRDATTFTRRQVRAALGLNRAVWMNGYTAIFQALRDDHPGGAPRLGRRWAGAFRRVAYGEYELTARGERLVTALLGSV